MSLLFFPIGVSNSQSYLRAARECVWNIGTSISSLNKYFEFKKLMGRRGAPELELLAVVIVLFAPILHETLTNSNFDTNTIWQLSHGSLFKCMLVTTV